MKATVAYVLGVFPKLSETFVLNEILELRRSGVNVRIYSMVEPWEYVHHSAADSLGTDTVYLSARRAKRWEKLVCHLRLFGASPPAYLDTLRLVRRARDEQLSWLFRTGSPLAWEMRRAKVKHIHAHFANEPAALAMVLSGLTGIPYSFTAHAADIFVRPRLLAEKLRRAKFVVTISEYNRQVLARSCPELPAAKLVVVHCGVDTAKFSPDSKPAVHPPAILSVARMAEKKGLRYLVDACRMLVAAGHTDLRCELIGDGPEEGSLRELVESYGLGEVVRFRGPCHEEEVRQALAGCSVFVAPCVVAADGDRDGIPVSLMEAMSMGKPVVSTAVSGIPELVQDGRNGLLVPPRDAAALASAIQRIIAAPDWAAELGQEARRTVEREFNIRHTARALAQLLAASSAG